MSLVNLTMIQTDSICINPLDHPTPEVTRLEGAPPISNLLSSFDNSSCAPLIFYILHHRTEGATGGSDPRTKVAGQRRRTKDTLAIRRDSVRRKACADL